MSQTGNDLDATINLFPVKIPVLPNIACVAGKSFFINGILSCNAVFFLMPQFVQE